MRIGILWLIALFVVVGCGKEKQNEASLSEEEMIELLVDMHKTDALLSRAVNRGDVRKEEVIQYYKGVLDKHNISRGQFDSVFNFYSKNYKKFEEMYGDVIARIQKEEDSLKHTKVKKQPEKPKPNQEDLFDKTFYIQSALSYGKSQTGFWDLVGKRPKMIDSVYLRIWENDSAPDKKFIFEAGVQDGFYKISTNYNKNYCLTVNQGKNINLLFAQFLPCENDSIQDFRFKHIRNGSFKIYDFSDRVVYVDRTTENGSFVKVSKDHPGKWTEWYLLDIETGKPYIP
jgi:hypothetical protein